MALSPQETKVYEFAGYRLDAGKRLLYGPDGETLRLMPKAFDILHCLVANSGRAIDKDELIATVWPDTIVEENNLTQNISTLRRILGEKHGDNRFIATIPGRGYKFVAAVALVRDLGADRSTDNSVAVVSEAASAGPRRRLWWVAPASLAAVAIIAGTLFYSARPISPQQQIRSIAILPFKPITAEKRDEALEMGMADTLISKLSGSGVKVTPLTAVYRFASPQQDAVDAGRQLNVEAVLDGGVQIADDRVRVSAKLIRVSDGQQIWSGRFDEQLTDIFAVQDSISEKVAAALKIPLSAQNRRDYTQNVEAYQLYLKGKFHESRFVLPELQQAISFFNEAIAVDPSFALAYVELSNSYRAMVLTNDALPSEMMPRARAAAQKAVELDPDLAGSWTMLAFCDFWYDWDWPAAEEHFKKALELDPTNARTHAFYAHFLSNLGRHPEAIDEAKRARQIDPLDLLINAMEGQILCFAGNDDESIRSLRSLISIDPNFWLAHLFISRAYIKRAMWAEAAAAATKAVELTNGNAEAVATAAFAMSRAGQRSEAMKKVAELTTRSKSRFVPSYVLAVCALAADDKVRAMDLLEEAIEHRDPLMVFLKVEPKLDGLRNEPRFAQLMKRMNL